MTSRRDFLGILAIAPAIVPEAVKVAAGPRYVGGISSHTLGFAELIGEDCHGGFVLSPSQSKEFLAAFDAPMTRLDPISISMRSPSPWEQPVFVGVDMAAGDDRTGYWAPAPNRLLGAYINEDGDAI